MNGTEDYPCENNIPLRLKSVLDNSKGTASLICNWCTALHPGQAKLFQHRKMLSGNPVPDVKDRSILFDKIYLTGYLATNTCPMPAECQL